MFVAFFIRVFIPIPLNYTKRINLRAYAHDSGTSSPWCLNRWSSV